MSKPISNLYHGTKGSYSNDNYTFAAITRSQAITWARKQVDELSKKSKRQRDRLNTVSAVFDEETGKFYYGRNGGLFLNGDSKNSILFGDEKTPGLLPKESLNDYKIGNCAEVDAINQALNDGASLKNLHISTIHSTKSSFGMPKKSCQNCTYAFKDRIKHNYTGWWK